MCWDQLLREGRVPNQNEIALGTVWNDWQTNWTGATNFCGNCNRW